MRSVVVAGLLASVLTIGGLFLASPAGAQCEVDGDDFTGDDGEFDLEGYLEAQEECAEVEGAVQTPEGGQTTSGQTASAPALAVTGSETSTLVGYGVALVLVGGTVILLVRRRSS